jgi:ubiquinone/menaquinone biosynthesis C-methylase UbiE
VTLPRAEHAPEYLDEPAHDPRVLTQSLAHVAAVNRWLGGRRALLHHLGALLPAQGRAEVLDVGTGSGDLPRAIADHARDSRRPIRIVATDNHPQILDVARTHCASYPEIEVQRADALALPFADDAFDVALLSMVLHHLEGADQVHALRELARVSRRGVIVGELERSRINYLGARLLSATVWRGNRLTRHDGPLSVKRAFTPGELLRIAGEAGLRKARVYRHVFYRLVLLIET